jgi:hypothetical protein
MREFFADTHANVRVEECAEALGTVARPHTAFSRIRRSKLRTGENLVKPRADFRSQNVLIS